jgi:hypothetical protein
MNLTEPIIEDAVLLSGELRVPSAGKSVNHTA